MTMHTIALPEHVLTPEPLTLSIIFPVFGAIPSANSIRRLKSAIANFDGLPPLVLGPYYHEHYDPSFNAMFDDIEAARRIVFEKDKPGSKNLGFYPSADEGIRISHTSWRAPYGVTLGSADLPCLRTTALLLRGDDAGRLTSFTVFSLRALSHRLTGRADGRKQETLVPNAHFAFAYVPDGDGGYELTFFADPEIRPRRDYDAASRAVVWLLERRKAKPADDRRCR